jgi:hypothetical protein
VTISARDRLIVALDLPSVAEAEKAVADLGDTVSFYKVGYELVLAGGLEFAVGLVRSGEAFLDPAARHRQHRDARERARRCARRDLSPCMHFRRP